MVVKQKFIGDTKDLEKAYDTLLRKQTQQEQKLRDLQARSRKGNRESKEGHDNNNASMNVGIGKLATMAAGYLSVASAVRVVTGALEDKRRLEREMHQATMTQAGAEAAVAINFGDRTPAELETFLGKIKTIQQETGFPSLGPLTQAAGEGLSAAQGKRPAVLAALRASAMISRDLPGQLRSVAGTALDITGSTGTTDAKAALGMFIQTQGEARVADMGLAGQALAPAISSGVLAGGADRQQSAREAAALWATFTATTGEKTGMAAKTSTQKFVGQIRDFFGPTGREDDTRAGRLRPGMADPGTIGGRLAALQADPALGAAFMKQKTFEEQYRPVVSALVQPEGSLIDVAGKYTETLEKIHFDPAAFERKAQLMQRGSPALVASGAAAGLSAALEAGRLADPQIGMVANAADAARLAIMQSRVKGGNIGDWVDRWVGAKLVGYGDMPQWLGGGKEMGRFAGDELDTAIGEVQSRIGRLRTGRIPSDPSLETFQRSGLERAMMPEVSESALRRAELLSEILEQLKNIRTETETGNIQAAGSAAATQPGTHRE